MNAKLKNTGKTIMDDYTMSLELKCKMLEEKVRKLEEKCSLATKIFINAQNMAFDYSNSPEYQKCKVDRLPKILKFEKVDYVLLLAYYKHKYNKRDNLSYLKKSE